MARQLFFIVKIITILITHNTEQGSKRNGVSVWVCIACLSLTRLCGAPEGKLPWRRRCASVAIRQSSYDTSIVTKHLYTPTTTVARLEGTLPINTKRVL